MPNLLAADDDGRKVGLVYRNDTLSNEPATHVLIIGVAAYQSEKFKTPLATATISARELADWFVGREKARFDNPNCGLGSLTLLLSETTETSRKEKAQYADGPVPRATQDQVKKAISAWVKRINSHKDNTAVLYIACHGESFLDRTGFILEDYGTQETDVTFGMSDVEQFIGAMEHAKATKQLLLFDCCRVPTDMHLPRGGHLGAPLINLSRDTNDHGEQRKQWVICATSLGEYAIGLRKGPTLFNAALISALNGVASDPTTDGWPVRPGPLVYNIERILALYRLPEEKFQIPEGNFSGSFDISLAREQTVVPVYISLDKPDEWAGSTIAITVNGISGSGSSDNPIQIHGNERGPPFYRCELQEDAVINVNATRGDNELGSASARVRAPAVFLEVKRSTPVGPSEVKRLHSMDAKTQFVIDVTSPISVAKGAVINIIRRDMPNMKARSIPVKLGGKTTINADPGTYDVTLRSPDGKVQTHTIKLNKGTKLKVPFALKPPSQGLMKMAAISGALKQFDQQPMGRRSVQPAIFESDRTRGGKTDHDLMSYALDVGPFSEHEAVELSADAKVEVEIAGGFDMNLDIRAIGDARMSVVAAGEDARLSYFNVRDDIPARFAQDMQLHERPLFARITLSDGYTEYAVIPAIGNSAAIAAGGWTPHLIIDRRADPNESRTTIFVEDNEWAGLLGFLAARDFASGVTLLGGGLQQATRIAAEVNPHNPLAALACALVALGARDGGNEDGANQWLENIATSFPSVPDGPILLGRRLLTHARSREQIAAAREWFSEGYRRGIPVYSLSVNWLSRGLAGMPGDDDELAEMKRRARLLWQRTDAAQAFTVFRKIDGEKSSR